MRPYSGSARHRRDGLEAGDDLVACRSGGKREGDGVLERCGGGIDGDGRCETHECGGPRVDDGACEEAAFYRDRLEERVVV